MSRAPARPAAAQQAAAQQAAPATNGRMVELRVTANLMTLESGLYCLYQQPGQVAPPQDGSGLPGIRISLPPMASNGTDAISIRGLHPDGWLGPQDGAALVHVRPRAAQILVTVYQSPTHPAEAAPRLKVVRLEPDAVAAPAAAAAQPVPPPAAPAKAPPAKSTQAASADVVAHIQRAGDVGVRFGEWLGTKGSKQWVEGFGIAAPQGINAEEIEYQAVLGRGWLSPWTTAGKFCGSRGMALPLLGFNLRLRGKMAERFDCAYAGTFTDGTEVGPVPAGRACEAPSLAPLESLRIDLVPRAQAASAAKPAATAKKPARKAPAARTR